MSYPVFLIISVLVMLFVATTLAGPLSVLAILGFWVAHYFFLNWRNNSASVESMSNSELYDVLDWWTGGGPYGRNRPNLSRIRQNGTESELKVALTRVISIYDERVRRTEVLGLDATHEKFKRNLLASELLNMSNGIAKQ